MKLQIKHLAPYLPYDLNVVCLDKGVTFFNKQISIHSFRISKNFVHNTYQLIYRNEGVCMENIKPILRPRSDLKKGFHKDFDELLFDENNYVYTDEIGIKATPSIELFIGDGCNNTIIFNSVIEIYNLLLKHHFDVFGLIEKDLAININNL
jgi:hypothetical protein